MKFSITNFFKLAFRLLMIFMLVFVWVRYYSSSLNFAIWISVLITLVIEVIMNFIRKKHFEKLGLKQSEIKLADSIINKLAFNTQSQNIDLFFKILEKKESVKKHKNFLLLTNESGENFALYPAFSFADFSVDELAKALQKVKNLKLKRLIICTKSSTKHAKDIAQKAPFEILILQKQEVYSKLFKAYDYKVKQDELFDIENVTQEIKFKDIAKNAIAPKKTKSYFFSSLVILFASYFVPYKLYYIIFASFLLVLSIASFTSIWWKKQTDKNIF